MNQYKALEIAIAIRLESRNLSSLRSDEASLISFVGRGNTFLNNKFGALSKQNVVNVVIIGTISRQINVETVDSNDHRTIKLKDQQLEKVVEVMERKIIMQGYAGVRKYEVCQ